MGDDKTYHGACFCGSVQFQVTGEPAGMGYCHCASCRHWSAGPINGFTLWNPSALRVTKGEELIATHNKTPRSDRKWCKRCGGHLFAAHPHWDLIDVYAATLPELPFKPGLHVNYQETVLCVRDGLPKMRDLPKELGGSGETVPE